METQKSVSEKPLVGCSALQTVRTMRVCWHKRGHLPPALFQSLPTDPTTGAFNLSPVNMCLAMGREGGGDEKTLMVAFLATV